MENRTQALPVTGTDIWYYYICKRECWLMMHKIEPDPEDENLEIGRFLHEYRYGKGRKEVFADAVSIDRMKTEQGVRIVQEIKKSDKFKESARYQLMYYLRTLKSMGIDAVGELKFAENRYTEQVELTPEAEAELDRAIIDIREIARRPVPPPPIKIGYCRSCSYREYCWAEDD